MTNWTTEQDEALKAAVAKHGFSNWVQVKKTLGNVYKVQSIRERVQELGLVESGPVKPNSNIKTPVANLISKLQSRSARPIPSTSSPPVCQQVVKQVVSNIELYHAPSQPTFEIRGVGIQIPTMPMTPGRFAAVRSKRVTIGRRGNGLPPKVPGRLAAPVTSALTVRNSSSNDSNIPMTPSRSAAVNKKRVSRSKLGQEWVPVPVTPQKLTENEACPVALAAEPEHGLSTPKIPRIQAIIREEAPTPSPAKDISGGKRKRDLPGTPSQPLTGELTPRPIKSLKRVRLDPEVLNEENMENNEREEEISDDEEEERIWPMDHETWLVNALHGFARRLALV